MSTDGPIRTDTEHVLSVRPLPLGYVGEVGDREGAAAVRGARIELAQFSLSQRRHHQMASPADAP